MNNEIPPCLATLSIIYPPKLSCTRTAGITIKAWRWNLQKVCCIPLAVKLNSLMRADELDFELPPELIAQSPAPQRAGSRVLHYCRADRAIVHRRFAELPSLLRLGDLLVFNNTKVLPARFMLRKESGGVIEGLFLSQPSAGKWRVMLKGLEAYRGPLRFEALGLGEPLVATCTGVHGGGLYELEIQSDESAPTILDRVGRMPLPPYIKRDKGRDARDESDRQRYQTVYASEAGSVAAPTAGLHFTPEVLDELAAKGIERAFVTLHVGLGTFKPVTVERLDEHQMHAEFYRIDAAAAEALNRAQAEGRRVIAVGTTSARVLESHPPGEPWRATEAQTSIFIFPPYQWRHVSALITNFHLPRSTLIALVAAMMGLEEQRKVYREAIKNGYRFFSYGDAMFID
jgi:S-adenosylmethionine:tRNA ribosyltransferase-isomerase